jgi:hypothetical protein
VEESLLQAKIEMLIKQFKEEVHQLSSFHQRELDRTRDTHANDLQILTENFEKRLSLFSSGYRSRISELENEINYLKELNLAQRRMMEDSLGYTKGLEKKLNATRTD